MTGAVPAVRLTLTEGPKLQELVGAFGLFLQMHAAGGGPRRLPLQPLRFCTLEGRMIDLYEISHLSAVSKKDAEYEGQANIGFAGASSFEGRCIEVTGLFNFGFSRTEEKGYLLLPGGA